jgi:hypothetical protein
MDIVARPCYQLPLLGKVNAIELYADDKLLAQCEITGTGKSAGKFALVRTDNMQTLTIQFKDRLREAFEIIDNIENCRWTCEFPKSDTWISFARPMNIQSAKHSGELSNQGLILLDDKCIGRIGETSKYPFGRRRTKIEVKDETYINLLMSIGLIKVLQYKVYRIQDRGI